MAIIESYGLDDIFATWKLVLDFKPTTRSFILSDIFRRFFRRLCVFWFELVFCVVPLSPSSPIYFFSEKIDGFGPHPFSKNLSKFFKTQKLSVSQQLERQSKRFLFLFFNLVPLSRGRKLHTCLGKSIKKKDHIPWKGCNELEWYRRYLLSQSIVFRTITSREKSRKILKL